MGNEAAGKSFVVLIIKKMRRWVDSGKLRASEALQALHNPGPVSGL